MPSKLEVISLGGRLARCPKIHMTVSSLSRAWQSREKKRGSEERIGQRGRYRQNQIEVERGRNGWVMGVEWWALPLRYLSSATDSERGSSGPVVIAPCSHMLRTSRLHLHRLNILYSTVFYRYAFNMLLSNLFHLSVYVDAAFPQCQQN